MHSATTVAWFNEVFCVAAMTSGSVQLTVVLWTCGAIAIVILLVSVFAALVHIRRRPGRHGKHIVHRASSYVIAAVAL